MPYLEMRGVTKQFPGGVLANDAVNLTVERGEIHALVGENGAGKSTLMNMLYGMFKPDSGDILLKGERLSLASPQAAIQHGIGMVHQHFQLVPSFTVAENVVLGAEPRRRALVDEAISRQRVEALSAQFGLKVNPSALVQDLSVGEQQRVEILKLLYRNAELLILDEPSAVLTPQEVDDLFAVLQSLIAQGRTAIFITHKLYEVMSLCQRATVLRRGRVVGEVEIAQSSPAELARLMVGHDVETPVRPPARAIGPVRLAMRAVSAKDDRGLMALTQVSLDVRAGEILGIAGVEGNGQHELAEVLIGRRAILNGDIVLNDRDVSQQPVRARRRAGLAIIPEDRNREGLSKTLTLWENIGANDYFAPPNARAGWMHIGTVRARAHDYLTRFDIRAPNENVELKTLSGGNAQKVVIARELGAQPKVLIAAQPTRGLDIGATRFVHEQLLALREAGVAVLLISADLDELLALSDRIAVLYGGRIVAQLAADGVQREQLGLYMAGKTTDAAS